MQQRQHLRSKLDAIGRDVSIDTITLDPLTLANVLDSDIKRINDEVVRVVDTGERKHYVRDIN